MWCVSKVHYIVQHASMPCQLTTCIIILTCMHNISSNKVYKPTCHNINAICRHAVCHFKHAMFWHAVCQCKYAICQHAVCQCKHAVLSMQTYNMHASMQYVNIQHAMTKQAFTSMHTVCQRARCQCTDLATWAEEHQFIWGGAPQTPLHT